MLAVLLAFLCGNAAAQESPPSSGYFRDLGRLILEIRSVQWTADICAEKFPESRAANQKGVDRWKKKYKPFVDEMTRQFEGIPKYWATLDPATAKAAPAMWISVNKQLEGARDQVRKDYLEHLGEAKFHVVCDRYPQVLEADRWNLERYRANEVATIRRGPK
jgi:hypothetical protein